MTTELATDGRTSEVNDDLNERRRLRKIRKRERDARSSRRMGFLIGAFAIGFLAWLAFYVVIPTMDEVRAVRRFEVALAAVIALAEEDRVAFEQLLVDDAPDDAYEASLRVVSIADTATMQRGSVTDDSAGVVTAEGYEIVVPLTADRRVVPDLHVALFQGARGYIGGSEGDPLGRIWVSCVQAVFDGNRASFEALLHEKAPTDSWEQSLEAVKGLKPLSERHGGSGSSGFSGESHDRYWASKSMPPGGSLRVSMKREGSTWYVEAPVERMR